ncbi:ATP-binding protein [Natrinema sp. 1APR25-10V2]|uniref:hybrid sensor histidine kinase/response regulator n=1 Tax=Natrinema sp. 1APR25-10V2 TaxID=2951081 RepID=UPI0028757E3A|nr:ATP-binding protein [Natrinema sp. 1APR25-10V2]MDS0475202.1 ATP-binding protein [Natrinema sp. 1APR25-10V2]
MAAFGTTGFQRFPPVIYADPDPEARRRLADELETTADLAVEPVATATALRDALVGADGRPCVVTEYRLEETDALSLYERIRADGLADAPFVLYTADGDETLASDAITAGLSGYVPKDRENSIERLLAQLETVGDATPDGDEPVTDGRPRPERERWAPRTERDRFAAVFEHSPDPIIVLRDDGTKQIVDANPAFEGTFGYAKSAITGSAIDDVLVPDDGDPVAIADAVGLEEVVTADVDRLTAEGRGAFRLVGFATEIDDEVYEYAIYTDVSERKRRERELERQNDRLDAFASTVSHDLRNPLTLAAGHLENLEPHVDDDGERYHEEIAWALGRMNDLIESVLALARSGQQLTETEPVALDAVIDQAHRTVDPEIELVRDESLPTIEADADRLLVLFENVFRNAREHAGTDATLTIEAIDGGFAIADDGPGVPPDERDDILESGYSTAAEGTGFGLAIVDEVVDAHGWSIAVEESEAGGLRLVVSVEES